MPRCHPLRHLAAAVALGIAPPAAAATPAAAADGRPPDLLQRDIARGERLLARMRDVDRRLSPDWRCCWTEDESRVLAYVPGQPGAVVVDTATRQRAALQAPGGPPVPELAFADGNRIVFCTGGDWWAADDPPGHCVQLDAAASQAADERWDVRRTPARRGHRRPGGAAAVVVVRNGSGGPLEFFWRNPSGRFTSYGRIEAGASRQQHTFAGHAWELRDPSGTVVERFTVPEAGGVVAVRDHASQTAAAAPAAADKPAAPPDRPARTTVWRDARLVTTDHATGRERSMALPSLAPGEQVSGLHPAPDGAAVVVLLRDDPPVRRLTYVEAHPAGGGPPREFSFDYPKPGDRIAQVRATVADVAAGRESAPDAALFADVWELQPLGWSPVADEFLVHLHYRTHQLARVIAIGRTGAVRTIVEERSNTFIDYSQKTIAQVLPATGHLLWASERDGRNRLYRYDLRSATLANTVTPGPGIVRAVEAVDEQAGTVECAMLGVNPGEDPYHLHLVRHRLDGTGDPVVLTRGDGTHAWRFSPARRHLLDTWSRMDMPPSVAIRDARTGETVAALTTGDRAAVPPDYPVAQRFTAPGRDGTTAIHGLIFRPAGRKPGDRLPVIECIYAGPQDFHVPKSWGARNLQTRLAALGYAAVSIDGMGTNWRDKPFHDVCHKNLRDAGLPDRIAWIKAAAAAHPELDISKVGIVGGSAGGQNAAAALIWHADFYQVAVANCGCHDNRIDKLWWNEAWMGWPVDDSYAANSNIEHADRLRGDLLLTLGEIDTNVDVACTRELSAALAKAGKPHQLHVVPGGGHLDLAGDTTFPVAAAFLRKHIPVP